MDITNDMADEREDDSGIESSVPDNLENGVYIRIAINDLKIQKCLQFHLDEPVWNAKQRILTTLAKDLRDGLNYGLYCPPMNGRAGKFLDEERALRDYPLPGPIGYLEFKYKRRVYKQMQINPRKLKQLHTKGNTKQFFEAVKANNTEKVTKFSNRGLDPNFHDHDSGETPLCFAARLEKPRHMIISLVSGGAHIDYRNKLGLTPIHNAALAGNLEAIKTLLDLGSSPNYKDERGLTPLYHAILHDTNAHCVELLLHDHSIVGIADEHGWCEVHHACKDGRVQHLEHLLFYGADMNVQNTSGNTPLHICAVNNQESCARVLLFRGADKLIQNYANQDAFQVAVIACNVELAEIIKDFRPEDVVPFQEVPKYNEKRRATVVASMFSLQRSRSDPRLNLAYGDHLAPSSPSLSNSSFPHYTSNGNLFESPGSGSMLHRKSFDSDSPRSMSISSAGSLSGFSGARSAIVEDDTVLVKRKTLAALAASSGDNAPRTVVLQKGNTGFGFVLRGAKAQASPSVTLEFTPTADFPALQYLDRVDRGSPADRAGLKPGDFLLEINDEVVVNATHEHTVRLIKTSGDTLAMKVMTVKPLVVAGPAQDVHMDGTRTLPIKRKEKLDMALSAYEPSTPGTPDHDHHMHMMASLRGVDSTNKTASIRSRPSSQRMTAEEIESLMRQEAAAATVVDVNRSASQQDKPVVVTPKIYSSVSSMKNKGRTNLNRASSTPNLAPNGVARAQDEDTYAHHIPGVDVSASHYHAGQQQEHLYAVPHQPPSRHYGSAENVRAPPHAPPPPDDYASPDQGELIKINTYANVSASILRDKRMSTDGIESSFRPGRNARMSKEPAELPPGVVAQQHSRTNSSMSSGSERSAHGAVPVAGPPAEPEPDYDLPPQAAREAWLSREARHTPAASSRQLSAPAHTPPPPPPQAAKAAHSQSPGPQRPQQDQDALMAALNRRRTLVDNSLNSAPKSQPPHPPPPPPSEPSPEDKNTNFLALAEKRRQEYLEKKAAGTLDRRKPKNVSPKSTPPPPPPTSSIPPAPPPPPPNAAPPAPPPNAPPPPPIGAPPPPLLFSPNNRNEDDENNSPKANRPKVETCSPKSTGQKSNGDANGSPGLGGLAAIIAQKAMERQRMYGDNVDTNGNKVGKNSSHSTTYNSTNGPNHTKLSTGPTTPETVRIQGATVDSSSTETSRRPPPNQDINSQDPAMSVSQRTKMFEHQKRTSPHVKSERPPPMVPPPPMDVHLDIVTNGHHSNGNPTVGWIINTPPHPSAHQMAIQSKIAQLNSRNNGVHVSDSGDVLAMIPEPDFIPPPPLFDTAEDSSPIVGDMSSKVISEDAASLVSSLSTLSTLSSNEQDSYNPDSSGYASSRGGRFGPSLTSSQSDDMYTDIIAPPPPPPEFGDLLGEESSAMMLPPPVGFNNSPPRQPSPPVNARTNANFEEAPIEKWSVQDVVGWLRSIGLGEHSHAFSSRGITGQRLLNLGRSELVAMGMTQVGQRIALERSINMVKLSR